MRSKETRPRLREVFEARLVAANYRRKTRQTYVDWVARLCQWAPVPPRKLEPEHVADFLSWLAEGRRSASTQKQALNAANAFFRLVLDRELGELNIRWGSSYRRIPDVLSRREVSAVLDQLDGRKRLRVALMYGCGLRKSELLRLRIKDLDFDRSRLVVRDGKGGKDREVNLPHSLVEDLRLQVRRVERLHARELEEGRGWAAMPGALARKWPKAEFQPGWQWLWPAAKVSRDPQTGRIGRHHYHENSLSADVRSAVRAVGIRKKVGCHTFRHSFATHMLEDGVDVHTLKDLLGHKSIETTEVYLHTATGRLSAAGSPLDRMHGAKVVTFEAPEPFQALSAQRSH